MSQSFDPKQARGTFNVGDASYAFYRIQSLEDQGVGHIGRLPYTIRVVLESLLRNCGDGFTTPEDVVALANWTPETAGKRELQFKLGRVLMQDFTGVPAVVDLAAMRDAMEKLGGDPARINPLVPADLVIDHSVQVDAYGTANALLYNAEKEFQRNGERYEFLRWGQQAFDRFRVVPPATGIVHQVNLEYLATVVLRGKDGDDDLVYPDSLVGTDSHTTMINGLGVLGWGVGGIEAEAVLLGQPLGMLSPAVVGVELVGELRPGATATDLVLAVTEMLRKYGVVGKFVEFFGRGLSNVGLADRATIGNMAPEYGATCGFFPVDEETLRYLRDTGRPEELVTLVEAYYKAQGLFRTDDLPTPVYSTTLTLDLSEVEPSLAGPRRPQDRVPVRKLKQSFFQAMTTTYNRTVDVDVQGIGATGEAAVAETAPAKVRDDLYRKFQVPITMNGEPDVLTHGSVVIAAITSCTNTSNPSVMIAAGILARKAVERGLKAAPHVKTSLAPGSRVVTKYLEASNLLGYLEQLHFNVVGYGCTTCIGNSGPVPEEVAQAVRDNDLVVSAVLSGNRNFEGRINPVVRANYLASPPLVVAYALAGTVDIDLRTEPLGTDAHGHPVYLADIWPTDEEIKDTMASSLGADLFREQYGNVFSGNEQWNAIPIAGGALYQWKQDSTYIQNPPYFSGMTMELPKQQTIVDARVLALLGDSVTTDHISPAGSIPVESPAGQFLIEHGVGSEDFNSYGARRGNHEVMMRGTFANIRLRNQMVAREGGYTVFQPGGDIMAIYDAAMRYMESAIPLVIFAGKEYGTGSSRDWAAKGTYLLGVRAVIAESFERIHRSNLVGMGVLPLEFCNGESWSSLGLTGKEIVTIEGLDSLSPQTNLAVVAKADDGGEKRFTVHARIDSHGELSYYRHGGILHYVLRMLAGHGEAMSA
ncbi:MAG: aconitate hydratase AcnA [Herpetosiphon sp.]